MAGSGFAVSCSPQQCRVVFLFHQKHAGRGSTQSLLPIKNPKWEEKEDRVSIRPYETNLRPQWRRQYKIDEPAQFRVRVNEHRGGPQEAARVSVRNWAGQEKVTNWFIEIRGKPDRQHHLRKEKSKNWFDIFRNLKGLLRCFKTRKIEAIEELDRNLWSSFPLSKSED